jgi:hypothetical protein
LLVLYPLSLAFGRNKIFYSSSTLFFLTREIKNHWEHENKSEVLGILRKKRQKEFNFTVNFGCTYFLRTLEKYSHAGVCFNHSGAVMFCSVCIVQYQNALLYMYIILLKTQSKN